MREAMSVPGRFFLITLMVLAVPLALHVAPPAQAAPLTIVSLTFDDGAADQSTAAQLLASHGMRGTFYVNSGRLGTSGYLTPASTVQLQSSGQEIGGHTLSHPDLPTLSASQQQHEICDDRTALKN